MWKVLFLKELRDVSITLVVAALFLALWLAEMTGWGFFTPSYNYTDLLEEAPKRDVNQWYVLFAAATAIVLGLQQTVPESLRQTWLFLRHRPMDRTAFPLAKWGCGLAVWSVVALAPWLGYLAWSAAEGHHASPFVWENSYPWWQTLAGLSLLYSAALLSGLRPARWFGTRLFPLAAAALWMLLCWQTNWLGAWACLGLLAITAALHGLFVKLLLEVAAERDYP